MSPQSNSSIALTEADLAVLNRERMIPVPDGRVVYVNKEAGVPASIAYIHKLIENGLGDYYDYINAVFKVQIQIADKNREPSLKNVAVIQLCYKEEDDAGV